MRICDAAVLVLRESGNPAVMFGDEGLLHMIADRAKARCAGRAWHTSAAILNALSRTPGKLVAGHTWCARGNRKARCFWLPEHAPERYKGR